MQDLAQQIELSSKYFWDLILDTIDPYDHDDYDYGIKLSSIDDDDYYSNDSKYFPTFESIVNNIMNIINGDTNHKTRKSNKKSKNQNSFNQRNIKSNQITCQNNPQTVSNNFTNITKISQDKDNYIIFNKSDSGCQDQVIRQQYNELPSRTIMMSNVPSDASEQEMINIFHSFGEFESYDVSRITESIATVNFYSLEDAETMRFSKIVIKGRQIITVFGEEMNTLKNSNNGQNYGQNKNSKNVQNNGTLVVFHLPSNCSDEAVVRYFSKFGKIRQVRRTPKKNSQRFIEFYDKRDAEAALLNFNSKSFFKENTRHRITIEYSLPGNYRTNSAKFYQTRLPTIVRNK
ncbi:RNA-binding protein [Tritrichomonas foetus]|uniref:RNA-binding protein n=1 Tax=Tritrichomonas foetus TaxID=1144522 RepID=A0A1J4KMJ8_9EUKA|nr:RNA-binding protein [Tritrichomonas foetus]|eukprot:OHT10597.1 RNA-binding protein [Tritrichomonas foetus]